jgi:tRNA G46 methylase TrmB
MATDWQDYAQQMMEMLETNKNFKNTQSAHIYTPRPEFRPLSKFEKRGNKPIESVINPGVSSNIPDTIITTPSNISNDGLFP